MEAERRLQIRIGTFVLVVLVALGVVVASLNREGGLFTPRYTLYADFNNIDGLFVNSPVRLAGNHVGRVKDISFLPPGSQRAMRVELDVDATVRDRIRSDSVSSVHMNGLLGDMYIEISLGTDAGEPIPGGGMVASRDPVPFSQLADNSTELLDNLVSFSASAERIVGTFEETMGTESVASTIGSLRNIVHEIETGDGMLHAMIYDDSGGMGEELRSAMRDLRRSLGRVNEILAQVEDGDGLLHDFIYGAEDTDVSTLAAMRGASERLESVLRKIDEGEGSLGALVNDPTVYEDLKLLLSGARKSALLRGMIEFVKDEDGAP